MPTTLAEKIESKNKWVKEFRAAKLEFDTLYGVFKPLSMGIKVRDGAMTYALTDELERQKELTEELEECYYEAGYLNPDGDDGYWDEASYSERKTELRIQKIDRELLINRSVDIPEDLKNSFPDRGTVEFENYIENLEAAQNFGFDPEDELSNIHGEISEWIETYCDCIDEIQQFNEWSDDESSQTAKKLISNLAKLWYTFIKSLGNL